MSNAISSAKLIHLYRDASRPNDLFPVFERTVSFQPWIFVLAILPSLFAFQHAILSETDAEWDSRAALGVVLAAGGYPAGYDKGDVIVGLEDADTDTRKVFHAGTTMHGDNVVTSGGRVLCIVGLGDTVATAAREAYEAVDQIEWRDVYCRRDIGHRAIARETA